jgi:hypothetical protein
MFAYNTPVITCYIFQCSYIMGNTPLHIYIYMCACVCVCVSRVTCSTKIFVSFNYTAVDAQSCEVEVMLCQALFAAAIIKYVSFKNFICLSQFVYYEKCLMISKIK